MLAAVSVALSACKESDDVSNNIKVFKYSGYLQCEPDTRVPLDEMVLELTNSGIDVLCSQTGHDGRGYATVCGGLSGEINIFLVRTANLEDVESLGYAPVATLPDYRDQTCR